MNLEQRMAFLENILSQLLKSDRYTFEKMLQISDGRNIQLGLTTGTKIGTSATQKLSFWGKTPVVQPNAVATIGGGAAASDGTARNKIDELIVELRKSGIIKT